MIADNQSLTLLQLLHNKCEGRHDTMTHDREGVRMDLVTGTTFHKFAINEDA